MAITGSWTLFYDWGSDGSYSTATMTVNANGTFTQGSSSGLWVQIAGMFLFNFNGLKTTYAGNWASKSITGIMTTLTGTNGSFYMLQAGVPTAFKEEHIEHKKDASGK